MNVHAIDLHTGFSLPGRGPTTRRRRRPVADAPHAPAKRGGADPEARSTASTRRLLLAYTAASILLGLGSLAWTTITIPLLPALDPGFDGSSLAGPEGGLLLWVAFGLAGSLRVLPMPGTSAVWTFHLPFVAAAMALGGPTAGAWVGFLATIERRELAHAPWYGTLANHAVIAFGAVVGGLTLLVVRGALLSAGVAPATAGIVAIAAGTITLTAVTNAMAAVSILLRERLAPMALVDLLVRSFGKVTLAEVVLACVFAVAYVAVGWWAPLALTAVVLLVWPAEGFEGIDPLMKLPRNRQFQRELESAVARARHGLAPGGLLLMIDLDGFGQINKVHGKHVGDEVLAEIGERLRDLVRRTDLVGRLGGDELAIYYADGTEIEGANRLATRVEQAVRRPVQTSAGVLQVGVSIGALVVPPSPELPAGSTLMIWADREMQKQKAAQKAGRSTKGIRFHPYGLARGGDPVHDVDDERRGSRAWARTARLEVAALAVAGVVLAVTAVAWVVRLLG
jgi:diguanylate cyclase (GGDEF)-like protein